MRELMISYHSIKKEMRFFVKMKGVFEEVPYAECKKLKKYSPEQGEILLQNQGTQFFDDIWEQFQKDSVEITFKGTKIDYEDIQRKIADYNNVKGKKIFEITKFIELPDVSEIYDCIEKYCEETLATFERELEENDTKTLFRKRRSAFEDYRRSLEVNEVNLCLVGTYSAGKSTFINALIGKRILPESINSETAKMFKIMNGPEPKVSFMVHTHVNDKGEKVELSWKDALGQFEINLGLDRIDAHLRSLLEGAVTSGASMG